jgi:hypothetical protein
MSEMKATMNVRISADMNVSFTFTTVADGPEDARVFGEKCAHLVQSWVIGYGEADLEEVDSP